MVRRGCPFWVWVLLMAMLSPLLNPEGIETFVVSFAILATLLAVVAFLWGLSYLVATRCDDAGEDASGVGLMMVLGSMSIVTFLFGIFLKLAGAAVILLGVLLVISAGKVVEGISHRIRREFHPEWEPRRPRVRKVLFAITVVVALVAAVLAQDGRAFEAMGHIYPRVGRELDLTAVGLFSGTCSAHFQGQMSRIWADATMITAALNLASGLFDLSGLLAGDSIPST